ncbi:hypothetical protein HKX48_003994 [Thoreauomyces humboldtii]|nr:hypothetical protein HKX48_003994 [Thoreauomyces humboldtii]
MNSTLSSSYARGREDRLRALERERSLFSRSRNGPASNASNHQNEPRTASAIRSAVFAGDAAEDKLHVNARTVRDLLDIDFQKPSRTSDAFRQSLERPSKKSAGSGEAWRAQDNRPTTATNVDSSYRRYAPASPTKSASGTGGGFSARARPASAGQAHQYSRHARSLSSDAWRLPSETKHERHRESAPVENPLLDVLEAERSRFFKLEKDYHKLLSEVQALQRSHRQELADTERKRETHVRNVEKSLAVKSEECLALHQEVQQLQNRHSKEALTWTSTKNRHDTHVQALERLLSENQTRERELDKTLTELSNSKKDLASRLLSQEGEYRKVAQVAKDREEQCADERKLRMSLEEKVVLIEDLYSQRDEELRKTKLSIQKQQRDAQNELSKVHYTLETAQKESAQLYDRNEQLVHELEQSAGRERKLSKQIQDLSAFQEQIQSNIDQLTARYAAQEQEKKRLISSEAAVKRDLEKMSTRHSRSLEELAKLDALLVRQKADRKQMQKEVEQWKLTADELEGQISQYKQDLDNSRSVERNLRNAHQELASQREETLRDLSSAKAENKQLLDQISDLKHKIDKMSVAQDELKEKNHERLVVVADKIATLQASLGEAQNQLETFRGAEAILRETVLDKDETIAQYASRLKEFEGVVRGLQSQLEVERRNVEDLKRKKKDDFLAVNEKFSAAKSAMEHEGAALRSQLQQKAMQIADMDGQISRLKTELSETDAHRLRFESKVYELGVAEESMQRQAQMQQSTISQKEHEKAVLTLKHQSLAEQLQRAQAEVNMYRSASSQKDGEIATLQDNVAELGRRLKAQVETLLERDSSYAVDASSDASARDHRLDAQHRNGRPQPQQQQQKLPSYSSGSSYLARSHDAELSALQHNVDALNSKLKGQVDQLLEPTTYHYSVVESSGIRTHQHPAPRSTGSTSNQEQRDYAPRNQGKRGEIVKESGGSVYADEDDDIMGKYLDRQQQQEARTPRSVSGSDRRASDAKLRHLEHFEEEIGRV